MKKTISLLLLLLLTAVTAMAQGRLIGGVVNDGQTKEKLGLVTVQLLKSDSTYVNGTTTNDNGRFSLKAPADGSYIVKMTSVGYKAYTKKVTVSNGKNVDLGQVVMNESAIMLKGATIDGHAAKVVVKEDTFQYNAAAYRVPEGSAIEELVKRLPGATVGDDGTITINGKTVKKILVDGKEFMTGDTETAMKNLPSSIIEKVKAYDQKSDLARVTGIDDGEEETVLDFGVKKGMNKGFMSNADLSLGTHSRYAEKLMAGYFTGTTKTMVFGNFNNVNDAGFPGGGGGRRGGGGSQGLNTSKMLGANFNYDDGKKLQLDGSVRWNHRNGDAHSISSSENFVSQVGSFSNSISQRYSRSDNWNANFRLEWKPDSMTNIMFRPSFSLSSSDGNSSSQSASFNEDPYDYTSDPLSQDGLDAMREAGLAVNSRNSRSVSYSDSKQANAMVQVNRKLNNKGRNITLRAEAGFNNSDSKSLSMQNVTLYQVESKLNPGTDSTYQTNRYNVTPTKNWNYNLRATYSEPLAKGIFLQFSYQYKYSYSKSDRSTFDFQGLGAQLWGVNSLYRNWGSYLGLLDNPLDSYRDEALSRYSEYSTYTHQGDLTLRIIRQKFQLNVGAMIQPQKTKFVQHYQGVHVDTIRTVTNFSPTLDFKYKFSKVSNLRLTYRGTTSQPSMTDLLEITDDSDPLNISTGNRGLKPAFTNNLRGWYNTFIQSHQRSIMAFLSYSNTRNSISNKVTYDATTGGRTTRPENINGNWDMDAGFMFNTSIDSAGYFNVNTFSTVNYKNQVGYLAIGEGDSQKNTTRTTSFSERLAASYRNSWFEFELNGSLSYAHTRNLLQSQNNMDTWDFTYGANIGFTLPWGTGLNVDFHENSRRGYSDKSMNTNELIWNAQISQSFLKGRPLSVMLQFYDILHNQSNYSRSITAMSRSDVQYNTINSYAMLHVVYRFNAFGGKAGRQGGKGEWQGRGDRPMGPPPGGFSGGGRGGFRM